MVQAQMLLYCSHRIDCESRFSISLRETTVAAGAAAMPTMKNPHNLCKWTIVLQFIFVGAAAGWLQFRFCFAFCRLRRHQWCGGGDGGGNNTGVDFIIIIFRTNKCYFTHFGTVRASDEWDKSMAAAAMRSARRGTAMDVGKHKYQCCF